MESNFSEDKIKDFVRFQSERKFKHLAKNFLDILKEAIDISSTHEYNNDDYIKYRKRVLDNMNDALREMDEIYNKLQINLK